MSAAKSSTATATTATGRTGAEGSGAAATPDGSNYCGRFAPTPSGDLHLGSLYTATAAYLEARAHGGRFLVRIEDLDRPREAVGAADRILATLDAFGFEWDGPVVRQSDRLTLYASALDRLRDRGLLFNCSCSRLALADDQRYPGTCRERPQRPELPTSTRLRVDTGQITLVDRLQGEFSQDLAAHAGDIILRRRDGIFSYVLAVVVDDGEQGVTDVVRGADLLDNTPRQVHLQQLLGLPTPSYAHLPLLTEPDGSKLGKSRRSIAVESAGASEYLGDVFGLLGLAPPAELRRGTVADAWRWAIANWDIAAVPRMRALQLSG